MIEKLFTLGLGIEALLFIQVKKLRGETVDDYLRKAASVPEVRNGRENEKRTAV
jgi:hypothetical protein